MKHLLILFPIFLLIAVVSCVKPPADIDPSNKGVEGGKDAASDYRTLQEGEAEMPIVLDHTIVPAHDHEASARFFAKLFGLTYEGPAGHFAPVKVNDTLTLDFDRRDSFETHHYAFYVSDEDFDAIFARIKTAGITYGSGPRSLDDRKLNKRRGGRGVYFFGS